MPFYFHLVFVFVELSADASPATGQSVDDSNSRSVIEKKTVINLVEAFSVAIKHYLRGEDGIYYRLSQVKIFSISQSLILLFSVQ